MASAPPPVVRRLAKRYNLDPYAVWAVAMPESGGRRYAIGDQGTSYGWWQLHQGGALPSGIANPSRWAGSRAGINYALRKMAESGAAGLHGKAAVRAIVTNFERPAAPGAEISKALAAYGGSAGAAGVGSPAGGSHSSLSAGGSKDSLALALIQGLQSGQPLTPSDVIGLETNQAGSSDRPASSRLTSPALGSGGARSLGQKASVIAAKQLGEPYVWGGESRKEGGFDCSGLIQWTYGKLGINLPRTAAEQAKLGRRVSFNRLRPGDLIAANDGSHIVMYVGGGKVIAAPHTGEVVHYQPVSLFRKGYTARRLL